jgi:hypothetical protein
MTHGNLLSNDGNCEKVSLLPTAELSLGALQRKVGEFERLAVRSPGRQPLAVIRNWRDLTAGLTIAMLILATGEARKNSLARTELL